MSQLEDLELRISKLLRIGVIISALFMLTGWLMNFKLGANPFANFKAYDPISFKQILSLHIKRHHWGSLLSYTGLVLLIALPVLRVFLTGILFIRSKEKLLALIAALVLLCLFVSFSFGIEL